MYQTNPALAYRTNQSIGTAPVKTVALLYDQVIDNLKVVIRAIDDMDIMLRYQSNKKAYDIIVQLCSALDHEQGGEIAQNLEHLYTTAMMHLMRVDLYNDRSAALEVIELLQPLRDAWHQLADQVESSTAVNVSVSEQHRMQPRHQGYGYSGQQLSEQRPEAAEIIV